MLLTPIDLIDSGMTNLLYMILKQKFKESETEVGYVNVVCNIWRGHRGIGLRSQFLYVYVYNFNTHLPILVIFGRDVARWVCY